MTASQKTILVTGGAGFIGGCYVRQKTRSDNVLIINLDRLTYAGNLESLATVPADRHRFVHGDICDRELTGKLLSEYQPYAVIHFAAETHVDRSIDRPLAFVQTNVLGTASLLEAVRQYWATLPKPDREKFRFLHVSTDEVFGSLGETGFFTEATPYAPRSPYSASKAGSDHLVRAFHETYGLPTLITNCSNNYGPYQFPEKLIPLMTLNALQGRVLPIYGNGRNVRDWLFVEDHIDAIQLVLDRGQPGETYTIGGDAEQTNLDIVKSLCRIIDTIRPPRDGIATESMIRFVTDRPGHDHRYAIDFSKIRRELGWSPTMSLEAGLRHTVDWYLHHSDWVRRVQSGEYRRERLGLEAML